MLRSLVGLQGFSVRATDDEAGIVADIYFDERTWTMRFLVVATGSWCARRPVLISPALVLDVDWPGHAMRLSLSRQQIEDSPGTDAAKPVSRQDEGRLPQWSYDLTHAAIGFDPHEDTDRLVWHERKAQGREDADPYLRSSKEVVGYAIQAADRAAGEVKDFLFEDQDWSVKLMVVDMRKWWPGTDVLVPTTRVAHVNYHHGSVVVNMTREEIRRSASYDALNLGQAR